jgi:hypothetical protein
MRSRRHLALALLVSAPLAPLAAASCGGGGSGGSGGTGTTSSSTTSAHGGADAGDAGPNGGGGNGGGFLDQNNCTSGQPCGDGGVCTGNVCCAAALACGDVCCNTGEVCSFQKCVTPGAPCHDSSDCSASEYCEYSLGEPSDAGTPDASCMGGAAEANGKCLPRPPVCAADAGAPDGGALDCLEQCEYHPTGTFNPVLKVAWGGVIGAPHNTDVMMTPIVLELDDDDCDGKITEKDIPEIIFTTFTGGAYTKQGTLHAISWVNGQLVDKWAATGVSVNPSGQLAGGNIDGNPGNEIIACGDPQPSTMAFRGDGTLLWSAPVSCAMPSIADLDADGKPEVIVEGGILDGATGTVKVPFSPAIGRFVVSDIDNDGKLDVVTASRAYHADGTKFVDTLLPGTWAAVADFDGDGIPEVVDVDNNLHTIALWRYDAAAPNSFVLVRAALDMNAQFGTNTCPSTSAGYTHGGGPPTIADFDGDGTPDVGLAGGIGYVVLSGKKLMDATVAGPSTILWSVQTQDCSSASTGSSVFDFDGDGKAEVIYSDERYLRIYDGTNGNVLFQTCNTTGTLVEYPVIADVDNDGHADIVVVSNSYASANPSYQCNDGTNIAQAGVRVFGDANGTWVRTRRVWNEHPYHVTNVNEDGTIPANELPNWKQPGLNNFRQNKQPGSEFSAPDAVVSVASLCPGPTALVATVRNIGQAALPAGVVVGFYEGSPPTGTLLGQGTTTKVLYPAESEAVTWTLVNPDQALLTGAQPVYAVVDDGMPAHPSWHECRTDNNVSAAVSAKCNAPK